MHLEERKQQTEEERERGGSGAHFVVCQINFDGDIAN